ncbi:MAG TPA: hypothetical protein VH679_10670 [Vicinamibacterales bacterium]|jgi:DNA-binding PadR family transcriptional regulator
MRLNHLEFLALLALARLGEEANAGSVRTDIASIGGRRASVAGVYAALDRLVELRLARPWLSDPRPEPGGRARRHYRLTPAGQAWLERERTRTAALWRGVPTAQR